MIKKSRHNLRKLYPCRIMAGLMACLLIISLTACGESPTAATDSVSTTAEDVPSNTMPPDNLEPVKGTRDNTAKILLPEEWGSEILTDEDSLVEIDTSHSMDGYLQVRYHGENDKPLFCVTPPDGAVRYQYILSREHETEIFPLSQGDGVYTVKVYEHLEGESYVMLLAEEINVSIEDEYRTFLYANQYCHFDANDEVVTLAAELAFPANNDLDVVQAVYNYVVRTIEYDYDKAASVEYGYLPVVDEVLRAKKGICFDYSALMTSMLRSQGIPTRLEVGFMDDITHAWISVFIPEHGWINNIISFDGVHWTMMDPTKGAALGEDVDGVGNGEHYTVQYTY